ncbi:hypothetical protein MAR_005991, partial [Mya arenaria]
MSYDLPCAVWCCTCSAYPVYTWIHNYICMLYSKYVTEKYGEAIVVVDGYEGTKDRRAGGKTGPTVTFDEDMAITLRKYEFLGSSTNKQQFINMLGGHLKKKTYQLILLVHHTKLDSHDLFFQPEPKKTWNNPGVWKLKVLKQQLAPSMCTHIIFMYAISGCDTTSRLYCIGKGAALMEFITSYDFREQATVFDIQTSDVVAAGDNALVMATSVFHVQPQTLPPTSASTKYHSLRVYYQVQAVK